MLKEKPMTLKKPFVPLGGDDDEPPYSDWKKLTIWLVAGVVVIVVIGLILSP
jgi:hypothetical protein